MIKSNRLFRVLGIDIRLHYSWYFIFLFITWNLAIGFFPEILPQKASWVYWVMGTISALFLFISVLLHELSHSLVAKAKKIPVENITLFFFGGVAGITKEEMKPADELQMAIAGPFFSLILAAAFYVMYLYNGNAVITAITLYLYQLNFVLAIFNLVPGYPLDGGRAFRAILHWYYKDFRKATYIAAMGGKLFAGILIVLGVLGLFTGLGSGLWFILLGGFLFFIARMSYEQVVLKQVLDAIPLQSLVKKPKLLSGEMNFAEFLKNHGADDDEAYIVKGKEFLGLLDVHFLGTMPGPLQDVVRLKQIAQPLSDMKHLPAKGTAYAAFTMFGQTGREVLPVMEHQRFMGIVSKKVVMRTMALQMRLKEK